MTEETVVVLWFVDPHSGVLDQVNALPRDEEGRMFYVSGRGTCLKDSDLFDTKRAASKYAVKKLRQIISNLEDRLEWFENQ